MTAAVPDLDRDKPSVPAIHFALVDGLRGFAAISVLLHHYWNFYLLPGTNRPDPVWWQVRPAGEWLDGFYTHGGLAVNVFWVISGFVFAVTYLGAKTDTWSFAVQRFARLYPLHLLTLLIVAGLQALALHRFGTWLIYDHNDWPHFVQQLFFMTGWGFDWHGSFNAPIWSVSVELLVYALFWTLRGWLHNRGVLAALGLSVGAGLLVLMGYDWIVFGCSLHFFFGVAVAKVWQSIRGKVHLMPAVSGIAACSMALGYALFLSKHQAVSIALGINLLFGGLVMLLALMEARAPAAMRNLARWIGDSTYGIYLWHIPIMIAVIVLVDDQQELMRIAGNGWFLAGWIAFMIAVGRLSFTYFESPSRSAVRKTLLRSRKGGDIRGALA